MVLQLSKKRGLLITIIAALLLAVGLLVWWTLTKTSPLDSVKLSNGKVIYLGESVDSLKRSLGKDLYEASPDNYTYPGKPAPRKPIEVLVVVDKKRAVLIKMAKNPANSQQQTNIQPLMATKEVEAKLGSRLTKLNRQLNYGLKAKGYTLANTSKSTSYYFTNPCTAGDRIILVAVAFKDYEKEAIGDGPGCSVQSD